jgi:molybdopterin converting factor subunit 1
LTAAIGVSKLPRKSIFMETSTSVSQYAVLLFASLKDAAGSDKIEVSVAGAATVQMLLEACAEQHPVLARWLPHVRVAVNYEYVTAAHNLNPQDEIALLPPVAGG